MAFIKNNLTGMWANNDITAPRRQSRVALFLSKLKKWNGLVQCSSATGDIIKNTKISLIEGEMGLNLWVFTKYLDDSDIQESLKITDVDTGSSKKWQSSRKNIYLFITGYAKTFDCVDHNKLWKILQEMGIPDHLTCLLRNLYAGHEVTVRTGHGTMDWFKIEKGVCQDCILSPCLFN